MTSTPLKLVRSAPGEKPEAARQLAALVAGLPPEPRSAVLAAQRILEADHRGARLPSGEPVLDHALGTAVLVGEMLLDADAISAALLAPLAQVDKALAGSLAERCGPTMAGLVDGVLRMEQISTL